MYTTPDGEQQSGKMSMQEAYDMLNNFRNNSKEFQKFTLLNGMAMNEMNTQLMMDVNNTVIGKGKDGKQVELVPVVGWGPTVSSNSCIAYRAATSSSRGNSLPKWVSPI